MLAAFALAAAGLAAGPLVLLWIGIALFLVLAGYSIRVRVWSDYVHERRGLPDDDGRR